MNPSYFNRLADFQLRDNDHDLSLLLPPWKPRFLKGLLQLASIAFACAYLVLCFR